MPSRRENIDMLRERIVSKFIGTLTNALDNVFGSLILKSSLNVYRFMLFFFSFAPFVVTLADGNYGKHSRVSIEIAKSIKARQTIAIELFSRAVSCECDRFQIKLKMIHGVLVQWRRKTVIYLE